MVGKTELRQSNPINPRGKSQEPQWIAPKPVSASADASRAGTLVALRDQAADLLRGPTPPFAFDRRAGAMLDDRLDMGDYIVTDVPKSIEHAKFRCKENGPGTKLFNSLFLSVEDWQATKKWVANGEKVFKSYQLALLADLQESGVAVPPELLKKADYQKNKAKIEELLSNMCDKPEISHKNVDKVHAKVESFLNGPPNPIEVRREVCKLSGGWKARCSTEFALRWATAKEGVAALNQSQGQQWTQEQRAANVAWAERASALGAQMTVAMLEDCKSAGHYVPARLLKVDLVAQNAAEIDELLYKAQGFSTSPWNFMCPDFGKYW